MNRSGICEPIQLLDYAVLPSPIDGGETVRLLDGKGGFLPLGSAPVWIDVWVDDIGNDRNSMGRRFDMPLRYRDFIRSDWASTDF